jgi:hypothetical protein
MKLVRVLGFGFGSLCLLALAALLVWAEWTNSHRIVPGPQNQSSFLKSYDPEQVIKTFRYPGEGSGGGHNSGASSGVGSVHHTAGFDPYFTIQSSRKPDLLTALNEDVLRRLALADARLVRKSVESDGGFRYEYASGNSVGSISVHPPSSGIVHRNMPLPAGLEDITVDIQLEETWTRP